MKLVVLQAVHEGYSVKLVVLQEVYEEYRMKIGDPKGST